MDPAKDNQQSQTEAQKQFDSPLKNENLGGGDEPIRVQAVKTVPEKDLVSWIAPGRPFKRRDRQFYVTTISIMSLVCLILFLAEGVMPVILIVSLVFLYYVLSTVEPEKIEYRITNKGIRIAGKTTGWEVVGRFWFGKRHDTEVLNLETFILPGRIELVIDPNKKEEIRKTLLNYLTEEEIPPTRLDKAVDWFSKKLPQ